MGRSSDNYDVVVVGGGPAGLSTAIRLRQLAMQNNKGIFIILMIYGSFSGQTIARI